MPGDPAPRSADRVTAAVTGVALEIVRRRAPRGVDVVALENGVEHRLPPQATLCSARGARDGPVSEWILSALLGASTGLLECARIHHWTDGRLTDLSGWTVLILGMGSIGEMVRTRLEMLGTTVVGVASRPGMVFAPSFCLTSLTVGCARCSTSPTPNRSRTATPCGPRPGSCRSRPTSPEIHPGGWARAAALAGDQLVRWRAGEPLRNIVRIGTG